MLTDGNRNEGILTDSVLEKYRDGHGTSDIHRQLSLLLEDH